MTGVWRAEVAASLRALAHPGAVLSLVLLVLNDHVLKQAWPGWVTGKLSDVAGLVVAPLLLAAVLATARVPRAASVAVVATASGFVFCKTTAFGAMLTSQVWSLFGTPTMIRADVTDLLALPALHAAWRIRRACATTPHAGWRRVVAAAVGTALLPVGVLATSATSCVQYDGNSRREETCAGRRCWRLVDREAVQTSTDGGRTWVQEAVLTDADRDEIAAVIGGDDECGDPPRVGAVDVAAVERDGYLQVVVALMRGGLWVRHVDGSWTVVTTEEIRERVRVDEPPPPVVTEVDAPEDLAPDLRPDTSTSPSPSCASPSPTAVTPNPLNGPPTTHDVCPDDR